MGTLYGLTLFLANHEYHDGPPFWFFGPLMFLLWFAVIGTIFYFISRRWRPRHFERSATERAGDILAERYAGGEISSEEYRERMDQLK